jgi:hypothetical protein
MTKILILLCAAVLIGCTDSERSKVRHDIQQNAVYWNDMDSGIEVTFSDGMCFVGRGMRPEELLTLNRLYKDRNARMYRSFCRDIGGAIVSATPWHYPYLGYHDGVWAA